MDYDYRRVPMQGAPRGVPELHARVRAAGTTLSYEIWRSFPPAGCTTTVEGDAMSFNCITDEAVTSGRVFIDGEAIVIEQTAPRTPPPIPLPPQPGASLPPPPPPAPAIVRVASARVACGAKARFHPRSIGP